MNRLSWMAGIMFAVAMTAGVEVANAAVLHAGRIGQSDAAGRPDVHQTKCWLWWNCGVPKQFIPQGPPIYGAPSPQPYAPPTPQKPMKFPKFR